MSYIYVLLCEGDGKLYIGYTSDLKQRIENHNKGFVMATKNRRPLSLIHYEAYISSRDVKRRELFLKGGKGHEESRKQLQDACRKIKYQFD